MFHHDFTLKSVIIHTLNMNYKYEFAVRFFVTELDSRISLSSIIFLQILPLARIDLNSD